MLYSVAYHPISLMIFLSTPLFMQSAICSPSFTAGLLLTAIKAEHTPYVTAVASNHEQPQRGGMLLKSRLLSYTASSKIYDLLTALLRHS